MTREAADVYLGGWDFLVEGVAEDMAQNLFNHARPVINAYEPLPEDDDPFKMGPVNNERWLAARLFRYGLTARLARMPALYYIPCTRKEAWKSTSACNGTDWFNYPEFPVAPKYPLEFEVARTFIGCMRDQPWTPELRENCWGIGQGLGGIVLPQSA